MRNLIPSWVIHYYLALLGLAGASGMHIPDGYLSPVIAILMVMLVLPFWIIGIRRLRKQLNARSIPFVALMAALSFVIMMFNIPLPGGTTGHAVGAAIAAIVLGPGIATLAISVTLVIQAFVFGDGGILAIGANCFTMAVVMPYLSYAVYQWIAAKAPPSSTRRVVAGFCAGYVGLSAAAFITAVLFGIQPALFSNARGVPLYAPYPLGVAIPAVMIPHLLVASTVEGLMTAAIAAYLGRTQPQLLSGQGVHLAAPQKRVPALWLLLGILIISTPLGLLAPGTAWGEWGAAELADRGLGFIPEGLAKLDGLWGAPIPDYQVAVLGNVSLGYLLSAVLGILLAVLITWLFGVVLVKEPHEKRSDQVS